MGFDWYISFDTSINAETGLPWNTMTTPIPSEHRKWLSGRGSSWHNAIFEPLNYGDEMSCNVSSLDLDNFPTWDVIEGQVYGLENENDYELFKAAFHYFAKLDCLDLNISY
jgi:hypothetical protein